MPLDNPAVPSARPGRVRLVSMQDLDHRTKATQIAIATKNAIIADLGGEDRLSTLEKLQAENAAMASAILRHLQVRWLSGDEVDIGTMVAVENVFNRTAAALGTKRRPKDVVSIDGYLKKGDAAE